MIFTVDKLIIEQKGQAEVMDYNTDLATKKYWDSLYNRSGIKKIRKGIFYWTPSSYGERLLELVILLTIEKYKPKTIMEIGCGDSNWLPYIAKNCNATVYGIDYSQMGCSLVSSKLLRQEDREHIFCVDFFDKESMKQIPKVDFIYSIGVAEHFTNTEDVIEAFSSLLKPNGIILTEVPNLTGIYKWILKIYQPKVYKRHKVLTNSDLRKSYEKNSLKIIKEGKLGYFWLGLIAWGVEPRFPSIDKVIYSIALKIISYSDKRKNVRRITRSAPYLYIVGKKK